jgi:hypothetical protein
MHLRSASALLALGLLGAPSSVVAQTWSVDEGTFAVVKAGAAGVTESFKIKRAPSGVITATGSLTSGTQVTTSSLTTDSLGTPVQYELQVKKQGALAVRVRGMSSAAKRFTAFSSAAGGEESMREYTVVAGHSLILEPGLLHLFYFLPLALHGGRLQVLEPGAARTVTVVVTSKGLDNITIAGRPTTATHYSATGLDAETEFWVDSEGRLLRVAIPSQGLTATREELPR